MAMWMAPMMTRWGGRPKGSSNRRPSRRGSSKSGERSTSSVAPVSRSVRSRKGRSSASSSAARSWVSPAGCTKTSMWPPQARPTSKATSSATPYSTSRGRSDVSTSWATSNTAPSMQPLDTEPAIRPELLTSILEPSGLGLEPHVSTTVARATRSPPARQVRYSWSTSLIPGSPPRRHPAVQIGQEPAQIVQRLHVVGGQEVVGVGQGGLHAARDRLIALRAEQGVQPDQAVGHAVQPGQLPRQQLGVAPVPAVADDDDDRPVAQHPAGPTPVEVGQGLADPGAAAEVVDLLAHLVEGLVDVSPAQHAGEPGGEHEGLDVLTTRHRVGEDQEQAGVALHGAAHVAEQHQGAAPQAGAAVQQPHQLPAGADGLPGRAPEVHLAVPRRTQPARAPLGHSPGCLLEQPLHLLHLLPGEVLEVLLAEQLLGAVARAAGRHPLLLRGAGGLRLVQAQGLEPGPGPLRGQGKGTGAAGHGPGAEARIGRRPEEVEGGLEQGQLVPAADKAGAERVAEGGPVADVDLAQRLGGGGQAPGTGVEPGVVQEARERRQAGQEIRFARHQGLQPPATALFSPPLSCRRGPARPAPAPPVAHAPGPPGTSTPRPGWRRPERGRSWSPPAPGPSRASRPPRGPCRGPARAAPGPGPRPPGPAARWPPAPEPARSPPPSRAWGSRSSGRGSGA